MVACSSSIVWNGMNGGSAASVLIRGARHVGVSPLTAVYMVNREN